MRREDGGIRQIMKEASVDEMEARFIDRLERGEISGDVIDLTEEELQALRQEFPAAFAEADARNRARVATSA